MGSSIDGYLSIPGLDSKRQVLHRVLVMTRTRLEFFSRQPELEPELEAFFKTRLEPELELEKLENPALLGNSTLNQ